MKGMSEWLQKNGISMVIALVTVISTYAVYGYRLSALEIKVDGQQESLQEMQSRSVDTQVALAKIQTDIEYIKIQLNKIVP